MNTSSSSDSSVCTMSTMLSSSSSSSSSYADDTSLLCRCTLPPLFNGEWHLKVECSYHNDLVALLHRAPSVDVFLRYFPDGEYLVSRTTSAPIFESTPMFNGSWCRERMTPINHLSPVIRRTPTPRPPMTPVDEDAMSAAATIAESEYGIEQALDYIDACLEKTMFVTSAPAVKRRSSTPVGIDVSFKRLKFD